MPRYIDADALRQELIDRQITTQFFNPRERHEIGCIIEMLDNTPTADVVEVVRCKDCVSSRPLNRNDRFEARYSDGCIYCMRTDEGVMKDDYCSYGERKEE